MVVDRVRADFTELPGLELTLPQAIRLWGLGADDCRFVIDALVDVGFLAWTPKRTVLRAGREGAGPSSPSREHIFVRSHKRADKSVGHD